MSASSLSIYKTQERRARQQIPEAHQSALWNVRTVVLLSVCSSLFNTVLQTLSFRACLHMELSLISSMWGHSYSRIELKQLCV